MEGKERRGQGKEGDRQESDKEEGREREKGKGRENGSGRGQVCPIASALDPPAITDARQTQKDFCRSVRQAHYCMLIVKFLVLFRLFPACCVHLFIYL